MMWFSFDYVRNRFVIIINFTYPASNIITEHQLLDWLNMSKQCK